MARKPGVPREAGLQASRPASPGCLLRGGPPGFSGPTVVEPRPPPRGLRSFSVGGQKLGPGAGPAGAPPVRLLSGPEPPPRGDPGGEAFAGFEAQARAEGPAGRQPELVASFALAASPSGEARWPPVFPAAQQQGRRVEAPALLLWNPDP